MTIKPPSPPYVGPAAHTSAGNNKPIHRIVIHCTVSPCEEGGARKTAAYFNSPSAGGSAHYIVDPGEVVQDVYDGVIAWHAPPNPNSIGIELTDALISEAWDQKNAARWKDDRHQRMLTRAADLVAQLALAYDVPIVKLSSADLLAGKHGICGHVDVSQAWHQSTHWDPGTAFPWEDFMSMVHASAKKLRDKPTPKPDPKPTPKPAPSSITGVIVQSGHNLATADQLTAALNNHIETLDNAVHPNSSKVILLTEQASGKFAQPLKDWAKAHSMHLYHPDVPGPKECAILSDRPIRHQTYFKLTNLALDPKVTNRKAPLYVVAVKPEGDDWIGVWHSPAHSDGLKPGNPMTRVYLSAVNGLKKWRMTVGGKPTIGGDFNARPGLVRQVFAKKFPHMQWAGPADQKPTEGGRVIDGALTRRKVLEPAKTLPAQPGFDHKPVLIVLG